MLNKRLKSRTLRKRLLRSIDLHDLEIIIIHYTEVLPTVIAITSFLKYYPELSITLIDNSGGRCCAASKVMPHLQEYEGKISLTVNPGREHGMFSSLCHGAGIDLAVARTEKRFIVSMETDTIVLERGGLERLCDLINEGNSWAGLGQKPYKGEFGSFSPSFAAFSVELARCFELSFRPRYRGPEDLTSDDLILKHHLETIAEVRAGREVQFMDGKPPDTYRRDTDEIIAAELGHLGYFDTAEWFHHSLS